MSKTTLSHAQKRKLRADLKSQKEMIDAKIHVLQRGLPHLYGRKWYRWAKAFYTSQAKVNILCAGNQLSKSSTQIRKCIHWATEPKLWKTLWPSHQPRIFWYLYPSYDVATTEFEHKWIPEFLPRDEFKHDPQYGWTADYEGGYIKSIRFNSGITVYFKAYSQKGSVLQTATVAALFCDEELPEHLYGELMFRLAATDGFFHMVLTNTLNQQLWYRALEGKGENELLPDAFKMCVSAYDCLAYEDGSETPWTEARIRHLERTCSSESEKLRRVCGRYIADQSTLMYPVFDPLRHYVKPVPISNEWRNYAAVDVGHGGTHTHGAFQKSHPAAIVFLAVNPTMTMGYLFKGWRGDGIVTTASDILEKYQEMRGKLPMTVSVYDHSSKDFGIVAARCGEAFVKADKSRDLGESIVSTLWKNGMLYVFDDDLELKKLGDEYLTLKRGQDKTKAKDDLCFDGSTIIVTDIGPKKIKDIRVGDEVLTRYGFRKVLATSKRKMPIYLYKTNLGFQKVTENHRFLVGGEFLPLTDVRISDSLHSFSYKEYAQWLKQKLSSSMGLNLDATQMQNSARIESTTRQADQTESGALAPCTKKFGKLPTVLSQMALSFIIRMTILLIILWRISNVFIGQLIWQSMYEFGWKTQSFAKSLKTAWTTQGSLQKIGIAAPRVLSSTKELVRWLTKIANTLKENVYIASQNINPDITRPGLSSVQMVANRHIAEDQVWITTRESAVIVKNLSWSTNTQKQSVVRHNALPRIDLGIKDVYNFTVEEHHEYYANGALAANCDAVRYVCMAVPWDFTSIKADPQDTTLPRGDPLDKPWTQLTDSERVAWEIRERRRGFDDGQKKDSSWKEFDEECNYWNEQYGE